MAISLKVHPATRVTTIASKHVVVMACAILAKSAMTAVACVALRIASTRRRTIRRAPTQPNVRTLSFVSPDNVIERATSGRRVWLCADPGFTAPARFRAIACAISKCRRLRRTDPGKNGVDREVRARR